MKVISNGRVFDKEKLYKLPFFRSTMEWTNKEKLDYYLEGIRINKVAFDMEMSKEKA